MTFAADATGSAGRLDHLQALVAEKLAELARTIALRQAGDIAGTLTVLRANEERHLLDEIRAEFAILAEGAQARIARARRVAPINLIASAAAGIVLAGSACLLLGVAYSRQRQTRAELQRLTLTLSNSRRA